MKRRFATLVLALAAGMAWSHDDATLDRTAAPHGGQLRMAGPYHLELVVARKSVEAADNPVVIYVTDHAGNTVPSQGMKATVSLLAGKVRATAMLAPDGDNRLKGMARYASDPALKAVVSLVAADGRTEQARFEPLAAPAAAGHDKH